ncbi:Bromodomain and PHD and DDT and WAC Acf1 DNA bd d omain containing protein [Trichuris trichiura]|uniref:Bromodomain and PHD and DDT and WAC Acf1 DNA bd d omain containing protein n=1 Tax=Trichuris trichiura TaxID=36087 RepID=A0A077YZ72_TRITR|nr:Bromodomain and PHD and DDT and WAC Acf1 DNA bd d omain containing protein [Trichuris trichiura]
MPLFMNEKLVVSPPPADLKPDEYVFYCSQTGEIYRGFESYFNRILLLKSCVWQCTATGRQGLTYQEALERELASSATLKNFPETLIRPVLFIVGLTSRSTLSAVTSDVYSFVSDHYFIGEDVEYTGARGRRYVYPPYLFIYFSKSGVVKSIEWSPEKEKYFEEFPFNEVIARQGQTTSEEWLGSLRYGIKPYDECKEGSVEERILPGREIVYVDAPLVMWLLFVGHLPLIILCNCLQESTVESYNIGGTEWKDLFNGPLPVFPANPLKSNATDDDDSSECTIIGEKTEEIEIEEEYEDNDDSEVYIIDREKERNRQLASSLIQEARELNVKLGDDLEKRIKRGSKVTDAECNMVRAMIRRAKNERKESDRLRRRQDRELLLEWRKSRDDLLCDDHKPFPIFPTVSLPDGISSERFGDCMSLLEFIHSYADMLNVTDFFPDNFSLTQLYMALFDKRPTGAFANLLCMLLERIFVLQTEEDGDEEDEERMEEAAVALENSEIVNKFYSSHVDFATKMSELTRDIHGELSCLSARYLPLDGYTLTEVLRVYFIVSGYFTGSKNARFRYLSRGGFKCFDDQAFQFVLSHHDFVDRLKTESVYEFSPSDRLDVLTVLRDQLLTFTAFRVRLDRNLERVRNLRVQMRHMCVLDSRFEKEATTARFRLSAKEKSNSNNATVEPEPSYDKRMLEATRKLQRLIAKPMQDPSCSLQATVSTVKDSARSLLNNVLFEKLEVAEIDFVRKLQRQYLQDCCQAMVEELFELMGKCGILGGRDRAFRHYWLCRSVGALLVEDYDPVIGSCFEATSLEKVSKGQDNIDGEMEMRRSLLVCSGRKDTCPVHGADNRRPRWTFINNVELFDLLMKRLNPRGMREMDLIEILDFFRSQIERMLQVANPVLSNVPTLDSNELDSSEDTVEHQLKSRFEEMSNRLQDSRMTYFVEESGAEEKTSEREPAETSANGDQMEIVKDGAWYAGALLKLADSIDPKYIENPVVGEIILHEGTDGEEITQEVYRMEKWKMSLSDARTYSSVLLHLATLENCIIWQKSLSQMRCRVCRRKGNTTTFAFCSECERPFHLTCLKPALEKVPGPSWTCKQCSKVVADLPDAQANNVKAIPGEANKNAAEDHQSAEMDHSPESYPNCSICFLEVTYRKHLIACSSCTASFHTKCASVKKSEVNVSLWKCAQCAATPAEERSKEDVKVSRSGRVLKRPKSISFGGFTSQNGSTANTEEGFHSSGNDSDGTVITRRRSNGMEQATENSVTERCNLLLSLLHSHADSWPFLTPVSKKIAPDYYKIIRSPMDLSTVAKKFDSGAYERFGEMVNDIEQIFNNCYLYNESTAEVYGCGERLQQFFCEQLTSLHLSTTDLLKPSKRRRTTLRS